MLCSECQGTGYCPQCEGKGYVDGGIIGGMLSALPGDDVGDCDNCDGGECPTCRGSGEEED